MSELESIAKLRGLKTFGSVKVDRDLTTTNMLMACATMGEINEIADEIEREIAERYMELPKDVDGVTIKLGDTIGRGGVYIGPIDALSISIDGRWEAFHNGNSWAIYGKERHIKPRTLEDILVEYAETIDVTSWKKAHDNRSLTVGEWEEIVRSEAEKCADEIRELIGGAE